jgi:hypothetical protein
MLGLAVEAVAPMLSPWENDGLLWENDDEALYLFDCWFEFERWSDWLRTEWPGEPVPVAVVPL